MSRSALLLALAALGMGGFALWQLRRSEARLSTIENLLDDETRRDRSDVVRLHQEWKREGGFPLPVSPPPALPGVRRLQWSPRGIVIAGPPEKSCIDWKAQVNGRECRLAVARSRWHPASAQDLLPVEPLLARMTAELTRIDGRLSRRACRSEGPSAICDVELDLAVPTLSGVGVFMDRLRRWPFVLSDLEWEEGALAIRGFVLGRK